MRAVKFAAGLACGLIILLLTLTFSLENPEKALYQKTVELLMKQEGLVTNQEAEEHFPILIDIQSKMNRIAELNQIVQSRRQGPSPIQNGNESLYLEDCIQKIRLLQKVVRIELSQLMAASREAQP